MVITQEVWDYSCSCETGLPTGSVAFVKDTPKANAQVSWEKKYLGITLAIYP